MLVLGFVLFNAGNGVELSLLKELRSNPLSFEFSLIAILLILIAFIGIVMLTMRFWHNSNEVQNVLV